MKLKVPYFRQERSVSCGLAALRMVLAYYENEISEKDLLKKVKLHSFGSLSTDLGVIARNLGYKITAYTFHLSLLGELELPFGTKIDEGILRKIKVRPSDKLIFESWKKYLKSGGRLIWEQPKISQLTYWINKKVPCIINVNTAALGVFWRNWDNGHYLVVSGFKNSKLDVLDPDPPANKGGEYVLDSEVLLSSWTINSKRSSDHLLIIEK